MGRRWPGNESGLKAIFEGEIDPVEPAIEAARKGAEVTVIREVDAERDPRKVHTEEPLLCSGIRIQGGMGSSVLGRAPLGRRQVGDPGVASSQVEIEAPALDRKSTRLNSSHMSISYAVFCLKKKKKTEYAFPSAKIKKTIKLT